MIALDLPKGIDELAPNLRWVQAIGAGIDHLHDCGLPDAVVVTNAVGVAAAARSPSSSSHGCSRCGSASATSTSCRREHTWKPTFGRLFDGSTVGLVGLGAIGGAVASARPRASAPHTLGIRRSYQPGDTSPLSTSCSAPTRSTTSWPVATPSC